MTNKKEIDQIEPNAVADIPGPDLNVHKPKRKGPPGATDCHHHIFGAPNKVPLNSNRQYTPAEATLEQFLERNKVLGIHNSVVVQPSTYGDNNDFICEQVRALGEHGRGVAVTDINTPEKDLEKLHDAGYRGTRFNVAASGGTPLSELKAVAERIKKYGWHVQFFMDVAISMVELAPEIAKLPVPVVIDHMGAPDVTKGTEDPGFQALISLLKGGNTYVKLCGAYRLDFTGNPWAAADPFARALIKAAPDRCVWGSDWPHPYCIEPDGKTLAPMPNDGDLFDKLMEWCDNDEDLWKMILVDTPAKLYGFKNE